MIVMKFGGTSTQDAVAMANVAHIVKQRLASQPVVVISAIAGATNALENISRLAAESLVDASRNAIRELIARHTSIVETVICDSGRQSALHSHLHKAQTELEDLVHGVSILRELTPRTLDAFYSYGELLSSRLVAAVLLEHGVDAEWLDTSEFMVTDEHFNRALPIAEIVESRLRKLALPKILGGKVVVTQGYIGVTESGRRTTMGRESSDYSAAVIGAALAADDIQIWTDVDGILTADPRVVARPLKVKRLTFEEAYELSFYGAKVLHPNTMLPAIERNIPIHIYNSKHPERSGTHVTVGTSSSDAVIKSVASKTNVAMLVVRPKKRYGQYIFWEHLYNILTKFGASPSMTVTSEFNIAFVLDTKNPLAAIVHEMNELGITELQENKAILSVVGSHIKNSPLVLARVMNAVGGIPVHAVSFGASTSNVILLLDEHAAHAAVRRVHDEFFSEVPDEQLFEPLARREGVPTI